MDEASLCCSEPTSTWVVVEATLRIIFLDSSSAFNTIQPLSLGEKLLLMGAGGSTVSWITGHLTDRPQAVRLGGVPSDVVMSDVGAGSVAASDANRLNDAFLVMDKDE